MPVVMGNVVDVAGIARNLRKLADAPFRLDTWLPMIASFGWRMPLMEDVQEGYENPEHHFLQTREPVAPSRFYQDGMVCFDIPEFGMPLAWVEDEFPGEYGPGFVKAYGDCFADFRGQAVAAIGDSDFQLSHTDDYHPGITFQCAAWRGACCDLLLVQHREG